MSAAGSDSPSATALNLQQAFKLALSVMLLYWLALVMNWDMPKYGALAIVLITLDTTGETFLKGAMRVVGSTGGLAVGMLGVALFGQDIWLNLIYHASFLIVAGYFMVTSRYRYAWFVAGYMPSLVWASTYGKIDHIFHWGTFRYLETTAGVIIYTLVCMVFWPRPAGVELGRQGRELWKGLGDLFRSYRGQLEGGQPAADGSSLRVKIAGTMSRMQATLQAAYADSPSVRAQRRAWELLRVNAHAVADAMELWRQSIGDCHRLDLDRLLPHVGSALQDMGERLRRIEELWRIRSADEDVRDTEDGDAALLEPLQLEVHRELGAELSHLDRSALSNFVQQFNVLDLTSREVLRTVRVLAGVAPARNVDSQVLPPDLYRPARWDPARLVQALLPAICFTAAYFFWIYGNPPTGTSIPNMAGSIGLALVSVPTSALVMIPALIVPMWLLVAPFYMFVMPRLNSGVQLLTLIFGFVFATGSLFVGRLAPLRTATLVMFVMLIGVSNQQRYSFVAVLDTGLMLMLAAGIVGIVQMLMGPLRPDRILLKNVRLFFSGCERVTREFDAGGPADHARAKKLLRRHRASVIQPALGRIQAAQAHLDHDTYPGNSPEHVQGLIEGLQDIAFRLHALEIAYGEYSRQGAESPESILPVVGEVRGFLRSAFQRWASLESEHELDRQRDELQRLSSDLEQQFEAVNAERDQDGEDDRVLADLYALVGSVRGLIDSMAHAQPIISRIHWQQWAEARF